LTLKEGITRFIDALDFVPTIVRQNNSGGMFDSFAIEVFLAMKITHRDI